MYIQEVQPIQYLNTIILNFKYSNKLYQNAKYLRIWYNDGQTLVCYIIY